MSASNPPAGPDNTPQDVPARPPGPRETSQPLDIGTGPCDEYEAAGPASGADIDGYPPCYGCGWARVDHGPASQGTAPGDGEPCYQYRPHPSLMSLDGRALCRCGFGWLLHYEICGGPGPTQSAEFADDLVNRLTDAMIAGGQVLALGRAAAAAWEERHDGTD